MFSLWSSRNTLSTTETSPDAQLAWGRVDKYIFGVNFSFEHSVTEVSFQSFLFAFLFCVSFALLPHHPHPYHLWGKKRDHAHELSNYEDTQFITPTPKVSQLFENIISQTHSEVHRTQLCLMNFVLFHAQHVVTHKSKARFISITEDATTHLWLSVLWPEKRGKKTVIERKLGAISSFFW